MSKIYLNGSRKPPTSAEISSLEECVGCKIAEDYLRFLEFNNGGKPRKTTYEPLDQYVQAIFPVSETVDPNVLSETRKRLSHLPRFHAYIGIVGQGNWLLLDCDGGEVSAMIAGEITFVSSGIRAFFEALSGEEAPEYPRVARIAYSGDAELLNQFLREGYSIESTTPTGKTIVQIAALCGDLPMVKACLAGGASTKGIRQILKQIPHRRSFLKLLEDEGLVREGV